MATADVALALAEEHWQANGLVSLGCGLHSHYPFTPAGRSVGPPPDSDDLATADQHRETEQPTMADGRTVTTPMRAGETCS